MKRLLTLALTLLLCSALLVPAAHADVIWEPTENSFYDAHSNECVYQDKSYTVPQDTPAYSAPGDADALFTLPAGENTYVGFAYTDKTGKTWGAVDVRQGDEWLSGWVDLTLLIPIYDSRDFLTDHASELTPYEGDPAQLDADGDWMLWDYPGSEIGYPFTPEDYFDLSWAESIYTDPTGAQWLYFPYLMGSESWVYVPDPTRTEPIPLELATPEPTAAPTAQPTAEPTAQPSVQPTSTPYAVGGPGILSRLPALTLGLVCVGVLLVAVISAVLIAVFYPRKKK
ncbi:MAG: PT domain-containing protein [Candidatus Spyradocola sp.]